MRRNSELHLLVADLNTRIFLFLNTTYQCYIYGPWIVAPTYMSILLEVNRPKFEAKYLRPPDIKVSYDGSLPPCYP
jgi:hypothetical protein